MKSIAFFAFIFSLISNNTLSGQDHSCGLGEERRLQVVALNDGSRFLAKSFKDKELITRVDLSGKVIWQKEIKVQNPDTFLDRVFATRITKEKKGYLVVSKDGSNAFFIEMHVGFFGKSSAHVTHIDELGEMRSFNFQDDNKVMGESLQSTFCDNEYLYFLTTSRKNRPIHKKNDLNYILNRFSIADFRFDPLVLDLPAQEEPEFESIWTFAGQKDQEKYMILKTVNTLDNTYTGKVISFDSHGTIIKSFDIKSQPARHYLRPSNHISRKNWNAILNTNNDYYHLIGNSASSSNINYRIGAYFNFLLDENTGEIYISGLLGENFFGKNPLNFQNQEYNGFFIKKFDQEGKEIWSLDHIVDSETFCEDDFVKRFPPGYKNTHLDYYPEVGLLNYTIQVKDKLINFAINEKGDLLGLTKKESFQQKVDNTAFVPEEKHSEVFGLGSFQEKGTHAGMRSVANFPDQELAPGRRQNISKQKGLGAY
ncbi:MAG: hypothetical protein WDZ72_04915 [Cyclobacteriaceae bacterium]